MSPLNSQSILRTLALLVLVAAPGCTTIDTWSLDLTAGLPLQDPQAAAPPAADPNAGPPATVQVDLVPDGKKAESVELPLEGEMHVQDALVNSGANKRFRRMNVYVVRTLEGGQPHKMGVKYDFAHRTVPPASDYALRPGDRVVAVQDTSTIITDMLQGIATPLAPVLRGPF